MGSKSLLALTLLLVAVATAVVLPPRVAVLASFDVIGVSWASSRGPEDPKPGSLATLEVTLRFRGRVARGLTAYLELEAPLFNSTGGGVVRTVYPGVMQTGEVIKLYFDVWVSPRAEPGSYTARLKLEWGSGAAIVVEEQNLRVRLLFPPNLEVKALGRLVAGRIGEIGLRLSNTGFSTARSLEARVSGASVVGPREVFLGDLKPGGVKTIEIRVVPRGSASQYVDSLKVTLSYIDQYGRRRTVEETVNLLVYPPAGHVEFAAKNSTITSGGYSTVTLLFSNRLDEDILGAVVRLTPGQALYLEKQVFSLGRVPA
jgi:hypothetical protein